MPYPLPLTRTEAYLAYKAGVIQQSDLKPSLAKPRIGIDDWLAYWTGLKNDYPKNPDGTPKMLQEEEKYIAYLCGVTDTYPDKCLRRVGAYLRYLISARWGRPDHPLNREELYLSLIKTQFIPSGDPSSDIKIDGTAKAPFVDVKMYGDTFQQSYSGSNLLNAVPATSGYLNGLSATIENDGRIHLTGVSTANYSNFLATQVKTLAAGNYVLSVDKNLPFKINLRVFYSDSTTETFYRGSELDLPISLAKQVTSFYIYAGSTISGTTYDETFKVWLSSGATATPFEPYVGGQASPNPDYPQPIQTVTGRQVVKVEGKNLLNEAFTDGYMVAGGSSNGVLVTNNHDGSVSLSGKSTGSGTFRLNDIDGARVSLKAGDVVTLSNDQNLPANTRMVLRGTVSSDAIITILGGSKTGTATIASDTEAFVFIGVTAANVDTDGVTLKPMLEKGSTATAYEPYSSNDYEIWLDSFSKNLFDKTTAVIGKRIGANGFTITDSAYFVSDFIRVKPNTQYVISPSTYLQYSAVATYTEDKTLITRRIGADFSTVTTESNAAFVRLATDKTVIDTTQFEMGATSSPYESYISAELCKLDTYQDYIWKDGEDWKVHKETAKQAMGDITGYTKGSGGTDGTRWLKINFATAYNAVAGGTCISNCLLYKSATQWSGDTFGIAASGNLWIGLDNAQSSLSEWLSSIGAVMYYPLATATDTEITNTALIAQLEALVAGGAENGTTYIKVNATDPNLPGLLYVEAPKYE